MALSLHAILKCSIIALALISFHEIQSSEGRTLKSVKDIKFISPSEYLEPTAPEHESGKLNPRRAITTLEGSQAQIPTRVARTKYSVKEKSTSEALPSPNMGAEEVGFSDSAMTNYADDFRPTEPGTSPGVGHSYADNKEKEDAGSDRHYVAAVTNDFRPTEPGHSPGIGHFGEPNA